MNPLVLSRSRILSYRRRVGALDQRLPLSAGSLRSAAFAGLQDSMPRAAMLSIHARMEGTRRDVWEEPGLGVNPNALRRARCSYAGKEPDARSSGPFRRQVWTRERQGWSWPDGISTSSVRPPSSRWAVGRESAGPWPRRPSGRFPTSSCLSRPRSDRHGCLNRTWLLPGWRSCDLRRCAYFPVAMRTFWPGIVTGNFSSKTA